MTTPFAPSPIRNQTDLASAWRGLMDPLGFGAASIWLMMIGPDDLPLQHLTQIEDLGDAPSTPDDAMGFADMLAHLMPAPGGRWAILRCRPGGAAITAEDRSWASALLGACRARGVPTATMHLATDVALVPFTADDLIAAA